jgi:hypothetical protein
LECGRKRLRALGRATGARTLGAAQEIKLSPFRKPLAVAGIFARADVGKESISATEDGLDEILSEDVSEIENMGSNDAIAHRDLSPDRRYNFRLCD